MPFFRLWQVSVIKCRASFEIKGLSNLEYKFWMPHAHFSDHDKKVCLNVEQVLRSMKYVQSWITILNVTCAQVKKNTDLYRAIQNVCMFYHHHILWGFILGFLLVHVLYCSTEILDDFFFLERWQFNSVSDFFEWFLLMPHTFFT